MAVRLGRSPPASCGAPSCTSQPCFRARCRLCGATPCGWSRSMHCPSLSMCYGRCSSPLRAGVEPAVRHAAGDSALSGLRRVEPAAPPLGGGEPRRPTRGRPRPAVAVPARRDARRALADAVGHLQLPLRRDPLPGALPDPGRRPRPTVRVGGGAGAALRHRAGDPRRRGPEVRDLRPPGHPAPKPGVRHADGRPGRRTCAPDAARGPAARHPALGTGAGTRRGARGDALPDLAGTAQAARQQARLRRARRSLRAGGPAREPAAVRRTGRVPAVVGSRDGGARAAAAVRRDRAGQPRRCRGRREVRRAPEQCAQPAAGEPRRTGRAAAPRPRWGGSPSGPPTAGWSSC